MKKIWLIRHGQALCNVEQLVTGSCESPLSDFGVFQVESLKSLVEKLIPNSAKIYTSSIHRAIQSAEILFPHKGKFVDDRFNEIDAGEDSEVKRLDFDTKNPSFFTNFNPHKKFNGGESHFDLFNRVNCALREICEEPEVSDIVIVAHAGTISTIMHGVFNVSMNHFSQFVADNGSLSLLEWDHRVFKMTFFNLKANNTPE